MQFHRKVPLMSTGQLKLAVIVGSVRRGRFGPLVADWFVRRAKARDDFDVDVVDLIDTPVPRADRIGDADAFAVITPEYNHSFPGPLKTAIDAFRDEWKAKPVGLVSYGGISGGLRAVEALRPVFAELHAVTIRETVSFHQARERFDEDGEPKDPMADTAATRLFDQLGWWGHTLREAKRRRPYRW